jgi:2-polyprenyl-3-methyl-5-hydroxy-6-metoxy-1,4-benzoquinol methylase
MPAKHVERPSAPDWDANAHYQDLRVAADYDAQRFTSVAGRVFNKLERSLIVRAFAAISAGGRIADVPCGTGRLAEPLLAAGYRVHGMDISQQMLDVATRRLSRFGDAFTTEVANAKELLPRPTSFDGVLCARVLMHFALDEQIEFLRGVARLTRGIVVINHSFSSPYQRVRRGAKRALGHQAPARHPVNSAELSRLLSGAGLRELKRYRLNPIVSEAVYIVATADGRSSTICE